jgi:mRNA-degrading endonuclease RelE of RelBE toxin-antitoxin system
MMEWGGVVIVFELRYSNRFAQQMKHIIQRREQSFKAHLLDHIGQLKNDPFEPRRGSDIKRLTGQPNTFRMRIGDLRIIYEVDPNERIVYLTQIFHRGKGY